MKPLSLHYNEHGQADSIDRDGACLVHLNAGAERTVCNAPGLVADYNAMLAELAAARYAIRDAATEWSFDARQQPTHTWHDRENWMERHAAAIEKARASRPLARAQDTP